MKGPRFEAQAQRWKDHARFAFIFSKEAHPNAGELAPLLGYTEKLLANDANRDGVVTKEEYSGNLELFASMDIDGDGRVTTAETLSVRRIEEFEDVKRPRTLDDRKALATKFRDEVPGSIPVLLDPLDHSARAAFRPQRNSAFVFDAACKLHVYEEWATAAQTERALSTITGEKSRAPAIELDWTSLEPALRKASKNEQLLLVEFTSPGCPACKRMEATLEDPEVKERLAGFHMVENDVSDDDAWALFESLELGGTPAFVAVEPATRTVLTRSQGFVESSEFIKVLESAHR